MKSINPGGRGSTALDRALADAPSPPEPVATKREAKLQRRALDRFRRRKADPADASAAPAGADARKVGILFVHGIGNQTPGETLLSWSAPIVRALAAWRESRQIDSAPSRRDLVATAEINFRGSTLGVVEIDIPAVVEDTGAAHPAQRWVIAEAWWASSVAAPSIEAVLDWTTRQGTLGRVVNGIISKGADSDRGPGRVLARLGMETFLSLTSSITALAYAFVRIVAAVIPVKELRDNAVFAAFDGFLLRWWGDVYLLLRDPVQAANVRGEIHRAALALRKYGCEEIVVVAHSGGTVATYMTLDDPSFNLADPGATPRITKFVTHGEAINLVRPLRTGVYAASTGEPTLDRITPPLAWQGPWVDFWATHDPAPSGALRPEAGGERKGFRSVMVWNRRSLREDHGGYMDNDEEFVLPLLRELDTPGDDPSTSRFPEPSCDAVNSRRQRVHVLTMWRRFVFVAPFAAILAALGQGFAGSGIAALFGVAEAAWALIPGHERAEQVATWLATQQWLSDLSAIVALVTLITVAIGLAVHAFLPVRQSRVWMGAPLMFASAVFLDWVPAAAIIALLGAPLASGLLETLQSDAVRAVLGPIYLLVLALLVAAIARLAADDDVMDRAPTSVSITALAMWVVVTVALLGTIVAIVVRPEIRVVVVGSLLAFAVFRPLVGYGARRWDRWDAAERSAARSHRPRRGRRFVALESVVLLGIGIVLTFGLVGGTVMISPLGEVSLIAVAAALLVATAVILSLTDSVRVSA